MALFLLIITIYKCAIKNNFDELYENIFIKPLKKIGLFFWKQGDQGIIDRFGPDGISKLIKKLSDKTSLFHTGLPKLGKSRFLP